MCNRNSFACLARRKGGFIAVAGVPTSDTDRIKILTGEQEGMALNGIVTKVTNLGAFDDVGVHRNRLMHVSDIG